MMFSGLGELIYEEEVILRRNQSEGECGKEGGGRGWGLRMTLQGGRWRYRRMKVIF